MKQFTSEKDNKDKVEIVKQTSIEKQTIFLGKVRPQKGHTMFEYNHKENTIVEAVFDSAPALKFEYAMKGVVSLDKKITKKPDCIYVSALNKKNALKILRRELNIDC